MTIALLVKLQMAMQKEQEQECINILMQLTAAATYCITSCPSQCLRRKLATFETKVERHKSSQIIIHTIILNRLAFLAL